MPHFEEMPSFLSDDTGPMLSPTGPPFDLPNHIRNSHEKLNANARTTSRTSIKGSSAEELATYVDGAAVGKPQVNGEMLQDPSLDSIPNGRSSASSSDLSSPRNGSAPSVNVATTAVVENGRRSPIPQNGIPKLSNGERSSVASTNGQENPHTGIQELPSTTNGDSERQKMITVPPPVSINPQSTGPLTYTTSLLPVTPLFKDTPTRANAASPHRFSSPPSYPSPLTTSVSSQSLTQTGPATLQHRHTLQVPKVVSGRNSKDGDDSAYSSGRFSPTGLAAGVRRGSLSLNRRHTQSVHSNMPHEEIPVDEDAMRWAEAVRQKRASKRKRKDEEDDDRVVVGTKVDQNHVNWVTAYNMLTGIRFTVSRTNAKLDRPLTDADFEARHKFSFDM